MRPFGLHLSISGGLHLALEKALELKVTALQIFLKNSNRWESKPYTESEIKKFLEVQARSKLKIFAHSGYLINLAGEGEFLKKSKILLKDELKRASLLKIKYLVLHPGNHKGQGEEKGISNIIESLDSIFQETDSETDILLENTAGQGTSLGHKFEHLQNIISGSKYSSRLKICLDTCHTFAAGYNFSTPEETDLTMKAFDKFIGFEKLKLIHLNDSKKDFNSKVDRHEHLGQGFIGSPSLKSFVNYQPIKNVPLILETPKENEDEADKKNLSFLKKII